MSCYEIEGNPGIIRGDPHSTTFAGVEHSFQGLPGDGLDQFYYIYPCAGFDHNDLPYHLIGRHLKYKTNQIATLDYIVLELFEESGEQYSVFLSSGIHAYAASTDTNYGTVTGLSTLASGAATMIGSRFMITYTQTDDLSIEVRLTVDNECDLKLVMNAQGDYNSELERYSMHYVRVNPPECYKCAICGLLGDFQGDEMATCDGSATVPYGGYTNAWDNRGWTYETSYARDNCGKSYTTTTSEPGATPSPTTKYIPPPDPTFEYDACMDEESAIKSAATRKCNEALLDEQVAQCCEKIGSVFCEDLVNNCPFDACFTAEGEETSLDTQVDALLTSQILKECDDLTIDEEKYSTKSPSPAPAVSCCKDQTSEGECLNNYINGKPCVWLEADSPLAIKFNTQCLGKSLVEVGPFPPGFYPGDMPSNGKDELTDVCHPVDMSAGEEHIAVAMNGVKNRSMFGYAPKFQLMVGLLSVASVWALCCISMYCRVRNGKNEQLENENSNALLIKEGKSSFKSTYGTASSNPPIVFV